MADLVVAANDGIHLAAASLLGKVDSELGQCLLLAHLGGRHRATGFARCRAATHPEAVVCALSVFRRTGHHFREFLDQRFRLDLVELGRNVHQRIAQVARTHAANDQVAGAHLRLTEHQGGEHPAALDGFLDVGGKIGNRGGTTWQAIQRIGDVARQVRRIQIELLDDPMQIRVLQLQDLMDPVHQLHIRIAAQLAEHGGAFDTAKGEFVELPEQGAATDFGHGH